MTLPERTRALLLLAIWAAARGAWAISAGTAGLTNISFDEGEYLFESLGLAQGASTVFYKGPLVYAVAGTVLGVFPTLAAARAVSVLFDLALLAGFYAAVRPRDRDVAFCGAALLASAPIASYFSFHLLSDAPFALFAFLAVNAYARRDDRRGPALAALFLAAAFLVKSTALVVFPALALSTLILRRSARDLAVACAVPMAIYLLLPMLWPQAPDRTFLAALPWMSFRCGLFYFPVAVLLAAGPGVAAAFAGRLRGLRSRISGPGGIAIATACLFYVFFTTFGDPQPKYVLAFLPFLALAGGEALASSGRPLRLCLLLAATGILWSGIPARLMESDQGMASIARYLGRLDADIVHTTIPPGVHQHAFAGALRFAAGKELVYLPPEGIGRAAAATPGGVAVWTDREGDPAALEAALAAEGRRYRRIDVFANRNPRPVYLVEMDDAPDPDRTRWEPNILTRDLVTPLDRGIRLAKRRVREAARSWSLRYTDPAP